jgi:hypothetical protein
MLGKYRNHSSESTLSPLKLSFQWATSLISVAIQAFPYIGLNTFLEIAKLKFAAGQNITNLQ